MCRLICAFVVRIWHKQVFSWHGSYVFYLFQQYTGNYEPSWVKFKYGAWYLDPKTWQKRDSEQPLLDPKALKDQEMSEAKKKSKELASSLGQYKLITRLSSPLPPPPPPPHLFWFFIVYYFCQVQKFSIGVIYFVRKL